MENRAAVFTNQPQAVEVYRSGTWWAGELLGWRHDETGACQVWFRAVVNGVEEAGWTDLTALRLPEPSAPPAPPAPRAVEETARPAVPGSGRRIEDVESTASLPLARDHIAAEPATARPGGRRRAPEDAHVQRASASAVPVPAPGRHRAPSADPDAGRHRDADTELFTAIADEPRQSSRQRRDDLLASTAAFAVPVARPVPAAETLTGPPGWSAPAELLTRPMRLAGEVSQHGPRLMAH